MHSTDKKITTRQLRFAARRWRASQMTSATHGIMFGFTPKAGCSAVAKLFLSSIGHENSEQYLKWPHPDRIAYQRANPTQFADWRNPSILKLKFVRNPYERAVSSYIHVLKHPRLVDHLLARPDDPPAEMWSFNDFLDRLSDINLFASNPHYMPQTWTLERSVFRFDRVIKIEHMHDELALVEKDFGRNLVIDDSILKSRHHTKRDESHQFFCGEHSFSDLLETGLPPSDNFYSAEIIKKIQRLYKRDVAVLGYPTPMPFG